MLDDLRDLQVDPAYLGDAATLNGTTAVVGIYDPSWVDPLNVDATQRMFSVRSEDAAGIARGDRLTVASGTFSIIGIRDPSYLGDGYVDLQLAATS